MTDACLAPIDPDDVPAGYGDDPEAVESWRAWCEYWNGLSAEDRRAELKMMDDYTADAKEHP